MTFATYPWRATVVTLKNRVGFLNAEPVHNTVQTSGFRVPVSVGALGTPAEANALPSFSAKLEQFEVMWEGCAEKPPGVVASNINWEMLLKSTKVCCNK